MENKIPLPELPSSKQPNEEQQAQNKRKELFDFYANRFDAVDKDVAETYSEQWKVLGEALITTKSNIAKARVMLAVGDVSVIEGGDNYLIKGNPKSGKTTACKAFVAAALVGHCCCIKAVESDLKVAYIDSEQKRQDAYGILRNVVCQSKDVDNDYIDAHFKLFSLRKRSYRELVRDLLRIVIDFAPDIIIIDGIADLVRSFNDEEAAHNIYKMLQTLAEDRNMAFIGLIHENKAYDDHNAKGHLGQEGTQRSAIVMETKSQGDVIKVTCSEARHKTMPDFYLTYDENGILVDGQMSYNEYMAQKKQQAAKQVEDERVELAHSIIETADSPMTRAELSQRMADALGLDRSTLSSFITKQLGKTLFIVDGKISATASSE